MANANLQAFPLSNLCRDTGDTFLLRSGLKSHHVGTRGH
jgi:hypothetical protein